MKINSSGIKNYLTYVNSVLEIMLQSSIKRVSLAISPQCFHTEFIDNALKQTFENEKDSTCSVI